VHLADEVAQHRLGDVEVGDDAVLHRADGGDVARGAAEHSLSLVADGADLARDGIEGDDGRLAEDDALVFDVNERVGGAKVDADVVGEVTEEVGHDWDGRDESVGGVPPTETNRVAAGSVNEGNGRIPAEVGRGRSAQKFHGRRVANGAGRRCLPARS